jgi:hypothetical protein
MSTPHREASFSREYFRQQVVELRERFGTRTFWQDPDAARKAAFALSYCYLYLEGEPTDDDAILLGSTLDELTRREVLVALMPTEQLHRSA